MKKEEKNSIVRMSLTEEIGPVRFGKLVDFFGSAENVCRAGISDLAQVGGFGTALASKIYNSLKSAGEILDSELAAFEKNGISVFILSEPGYPETLKHIYDPPYVLYVKGTLRKEDIFAAAVVGTRRPSAYGLAVTEKFSRHFAEAGITVVSGLALGVDTAAHTAVLRAGGRTIAVLGGGLEYIYPPENRRLADRIAEKGALVTEYAFTKRPRKEYFPRRNRIIAGLSLAVLVTEAPASSGALITAALALSCGREVFTVPGSILSKTAEGSNSLIRQGAYPAISPEQVIDELAPYREVSSLREAKKKEFPALSPEEIKLLELLDGDPKYIDDILAIPGMAVLSDRLLSLEMKGLVRKLPGNMYAKI